MEYTKQTLIVSDITVGACPVCGCEPEIEVTPGESRPGGKVRVHHEVICTACGLGAPLSVWEELCERTRNDAINKALKGVLR